MMMNPMTNGWNGGMQTQFINNMTVTQYNGNFTNGFTRLNLKINNTSPGMANNPNFQTGQYSNFFLMPMLEQMGSMGMLELPAAFSNMHPGGRAMPPEWAMQAVTAQQQGMQPSVMNATQAFSQPISQADLFNMTFTGRPMAQPPQMMMASNPMASAGMPPLAFGNSMAAGIPPLALGQMPTSVTGSSMNLMPTSFQNIFVAQPMWMMPQALIG